MRSKRSTTTMGRLGAAMVMGAMLGGTLHAQAGTGGTTTSTPGSPTSTPGGSTGTGTNSTGTGTGTGPGNLGTTPRGTASDTLRRDTLRTGSDTTRRTGAGTVNGTMSGTESMRNGVVGGDTTGRARVPGDTTVRVQGSMGGNNLQNSSALVAPGTDTSAIRTNSPAQGTGAGTVNGTMSGTESMRNGVVGGDTTGRTRAPGDTTVRVQGSMGGNNLQSSSALVAPGTDTTGRMQSQPMQSQPMQGQSMQGQPAPQGGSTAGGATTTAPIVGGSTSGATTTGTSGMTTDTTMRSGSDAAMSGSRARADRRRPVTKEQPY